MARNSDGDDFVNDDGNPFASPQSDTRPSNDNHQDSAVADVKVKVMAPAICLIVVGSMGLIMSVLNVIIALVSQIPAVDPAAPEFIKSFQQGSVGPVAAVLQSIFIVVNIIIICGAVQMVRFKSRPFAMAASILAIVNIGTCCCSIGAPIGIWSLIILTMQDVTKAFDA